MVVLRHGSESGRPRHLFDDLCAWGTVRYALTLGAVAALLTAPVSRYVWDAKPVLVDALAHYVHARYFAAGALAAPVGLPYGHWIVANTLATDHGWVSQYSPGHTTALALGFAVGAVWLVCPLLMGIATAFTSLTADRLFAGQVLTSRIGSLLFAIRQCARSRRAWHRRNSGS